MFLRALALLGVVVAFCAGMSYWFGAEVLAALGMALNQLKIVFAKIASVTVTGVLSWLKAQGINFARVEIGKRWFMKSILPLIIGAAMQRRIAMAVQSISRSVSVRYKVMRRWYRHQDLPLKVVLGLLVMCGFLALAMSSLSLWLFVFSVQLPLWIIAMVGAFWQSLLRLIQKLVFRTIAFMQLYRIWGAIRNRLPESYLRRVRRYNFRIARIVVKRRRLTVAQLHTQRDGLAMRWALIREYFRHKRPRAPSQLELRKNRERRESRTPAE